MPITPIPPYPMPTAATLPANQVAWRPDPDRAALLVHDMQRYFLAPFTGSPRPELVANVGMLLAAAARHGVPVFYTAQPGSMTEEQRGLLRDFWGPGMSATAADRAILPELAPRPGDQVLTKWRYSAFHHTPLHDLLTAAGRDQLLICGVYAHVGCLITASDSFARDIQPFLVADALADFTAADHRLALDYAARRCATVLTAADVLRSLTVPQGVADSAVRV